MVMPNKPWKPACLVAAIVLAAACATAIAQDNFSRPIRLVVPFAAGGSSDVLARSVAAAMSEGLSQSIVVDNHPGAGGAVGAEAVAHASPDGYTILFGTIGTHGIGPALYKNLKYDAIKDFAPESPPRPKSTAQASAKASAFVPSQMSNTRNCLDK
jgi:tripartite-type tricarboxylate transporter receptor subunit TctC